MQGKIKIIVVDDNPVFLEGISTFLGRNEDYEVIAMFSSGASLLENIDDYDPDLILIDVEMPGQNGIEVARVISNYITDPKLIAISLYHDTPYVNKFKEAGFRGFVSKNRVAEELDRVITIVMKGERAFPEI
jgi:DNA-binding NarL/FixJ family response regulator